MNYTPKHFLFFDLEWANSKNKSICQIGLFPIGINKQSPLEKINLYVNPMDDFDNICQKIHGITKEMVSNHDTFDIAWQKICHYFQDCIIVGHNLKSADLNALSKNFARYKIDYNSFYFIDTYRVSRDLIPNYEIPNYKLTTLCDFYNIQNNKSHDALNDAQVTYELFNCLLENNSFDINDYIEEYNITNSHEFIPYVNSSDCKRELSILHGTILGITCDKNIAELEVDFLKNWREKHKNYINDDNIKHIILIIDDILEDNKITSNEIQKLNKILLNYINNITSSKETIAIQELQGIILGIKSDNEIQDEEIYYLQEWLYKNDYLRNNYPYDKLVESVSLILEDKIITNEERQFLSSLFENIFSPIESISKTLITFPNNSFCLSGDFNHGNKSTVAEYIISKGGIIDKTVKKTTNYVVVGDKGSAKYSNITYGSKVKKAIEWNIQIIKENQLYNS